VGLPQPLTASQVVEIARSLYDDPTFSEWREALDSREALLHRRDPVNISGINEKLEENNSDLEFHSSMFTNHLQAASFNIEVAARSPKAVDVAAAQRAENFFFALFHEMTRRRRTGLAAYRRALDQMASLACGILNLSFSNEVLGALFSKVEDLGDTAAMRKALERAFGEGFTENPFVLDCPTLRTVAWEDNFTIVCEVGEKSVSHLLMAYPDNEDLRRWLTSATLPEGESWRTQQAQVYHLETEDYIYDVVGRGGDGFGVQTRPNLAGKPWYTLIPGNETAAVRMKERYKPLIGPIYPIVQKLNIFDTLINSGALQTGRNMWQQVSQNRASSDDFIDIMNQATEAPVVEVNMSEQMLPKPPKGYHWVPVAIPSQDQLLAARDNKKRELLEKGFPAVLNPNQPLEATSGYDRSRQMEAAATFLDPPLSNGAEAWRELFIIAGNVIQELGMPITIPMWNTAEGKAHRTRDVISVKPEDFRDQDISISFQSIPETVRHAKKESDLRLLQAGLKSRTSFMREHNDDPLAEEERIAHDALRSVTMQQAVVVYQQLLQEQAPAIVSEIAAQEGLPLPRRERPPEGSAAPGVGAPLTPPEQSQPGDMGMAPSQGTEVVGVTP